MKKTAVVSGGAGFLGSYFCERLISEGYTVICFDNLITGNLENLRSLKKESSFHFEQKDICEGVNFKGNVHVVCHLASPASPRDYMKFPVETMMTGSVGTYNMLELAREKNAEFLLTSTSEVYGDPEVTPQPETYHGNVNPVGPRAVYDEAKRFSESLSSAYHRKFGLRVKIARIFNTYGPRMRPDDGRVIPAFMTAVRDGRPLPVFGDGRQTRSFCYVDDMIEGLWRLMNLETDFIVMNLGNPEEITILELAEIVQEVAGVKTGIKFFPLPEDDPKRRRPDISLAQKLLKWEPRVTIKEGIRITLEYFRKL